MVSELEGNLIGLCQIVDLPRSKMRSHESACGYMDRAMEKNSTCIGSIGPLTLCGNTDYGFRKLKAP